MTLLKGGVVMADEYYTLIVIPDARSAPCKVRVSQRMVRWGLRVAGGVAMAAIGLLTHYTWLNTQASHMDALRSENAALSESTYKYRVALDQLEGRIGSLGRTVTRLGVISGVEQAPPREGEGMWGVGGVTEPEAAAALPRSGSGAADAVPQPRRSDGALHADRRVL